MMALLTVLSCKCKYSTPIKNSSNMEIGLFCPQNMLRDKPKVCMTIKNFAMPLIAAIIISSPLLIDTPVSLGQMIDIQKGASLFGTACIGCHDAGGNIIQPGATLFTKDLERNGLNSVDKIYEVTYYGKGRMPGFGETCTPRGQCTFGPRLKEEDIRLLAEFVKLQAEQGWVDNGKSGD